MINERARPPSSRRRTSAPTRRQRHARQRPLLERLRGRRGADVRPRSPVCVRFCPHGARHARRRRRAPRTRGCRARPRTSARREINRVPAGRRAASGSAPTTASIAASICSRAPNGASTGAESLERDRARLVRGTRLFSSNDIAPARSARRAAGTADEEHARIERRRRRRTREPARGERSRCTSACRSDKDDQVDAPFSMRRRSPHRRRTADSVEVVDAPDAAVALRA